MSAKWWPNPMTSDMQPRRACIIPNHNPISGGSLLKDKTRWKKTDPKASDSCITSSDSFQHDGAASTSGWTAELNDSLGKTPFGHSATWILWPMGNHLEETVDWLRALPSIPAPSSSQKRPHYWGCCANRPAHFHFPHICRQNPDILNWLDILTARICYFRKNRQTEAELNWKAHL